MKKYFFPSIIIFLTACELTVHVDVPFEKPQMTVNCIFDPDSLWNMSLSLNRHILDDSTLSMVDNANVAIYQDQTLVTTLNAMGNGTYRSSSHKPEAGVPYEIRVTSYDYGSISASSSSPPPPADLKVNFQERSSTNTQGGDRIDITFLDPPGQKNYYKITIDSYQYYISGGNKIVKQERPVYFSVVGQSNDEAFGNDVFFPDLLFDGEQHSLTIETNSPLYGPEVRVSLWAVSEDYYKYKETRVLQSRTSDNPFAQPVNVYNNISGGFGIFGGRARSSVEKKFSNPVITRISPMAGKKGDKITIEFEGGSPITRFNSRQVWFSGSNSYVPAPLATSAATSFQVVVPEKAITGKLLIFIDGVPIFSEQEFQVIN